MVQNNLPNDKSYIQRHVFGLKKGHQKNELVRLLMKKNDTIWTVHRIKKLLQVNMVKLNFQKKKHDVNSINK